MSDLEAIFLGLVQGLTEFLPVSSSGHLVVVQTLMGIHQTGLVFEIAVHVATLVSVILFYRQRVAWLALGVLRGRRDAIDYAGKLVVATLPAVVAVLLVGDFFEAQFEAPAVAGWLLMATGGILWTTRRTAPAASRDGISWAAALGIGCAQVVAILPGISRSGTTVAAALALGVTPLVAAEFSFMMSVVAITGAAVRALPELGAVPAAQVPGLLLASATALLSGIAAIWLFVRLLRGLVFYRFAYYTWLAGGAFLIWLRLAG